MMAVQETLFDIHEIARGSAILDQKKSEINAAMRVLSGYFDDVADRMMEDEPVEGKCLLRKFAVTENDLRLEYLVRRGEHVYFEEWYNVALFCDKDHDYWAIATLNAPATAQTLPIENVVACHNLVNRLISVMFQAYPPDAIVLKKLDVLYAAAKLAS